MPNDDQAPDVGKKDGFNGGAVKHTRGPWKYQRLSGGVRFPFEVTAADGTEICLPSPIGEHEQGYDLAQTEANARLLAASTDLLAVLSLLRNKQGCFCKPTTTRVRGVKKTVHYYECLAAQAAITKAQGESR